MLHRFPSLSKSTFSLVAAIVAAVGVGKASGELWVYEGFQYEPLTLVAQDTEDPNDPSLATGFNGGWADNGGSGLINVDGLTYGALLTHGRSLLHDYDLGGTYSTRPLAAVNLSGVPEIWVSFLLRRDRESNAESSLYYAVLTLSARTINSSNRGFSFEVGEDGGPNGDDLGFRYRPTGGSQLLSKVAAPLGLAETKLIVLKLTLNDLPGTDLGEMFVNPLLGQSTPGVDPIQTSTVNVPRWFDTLAFDSGFGGTAYVLDELRIGTTYADVTPVIPEPSSLLLLGTAGAALIGSRRRRQAA